MDKMIRCRQAFFLAIGTVLTFVFSAQNPTFGMFRTKFPKKKPGSQISLAPDFSTEKDYDNITKKLDDCHEKLKTLTDYQDQKREIDKILSYINDVVFEYLLSETIELEKLKELNESVKDLLPCLKRCIDTVFEFMTENTDNELAARLANMKIFVCPSLYSSPIPLFPLSYAAFI